MPNIAQIQYTRSVHRPGCLCQTLHKYSTHDRCITQACPCQYCTGTSTACEPKHAGLRTIGASPRLSMSNTVRVQVQRASPSTQAYARSVHGPGCPRQTSHKYSTHDRCIAQTVHAKHCTSTVRMLDASPRESMPNTVRVQVQHASPSTRTYARLVHHPGCPCQILFRYKYSVRAQARGPTHDRCIAQTVHAINCTLQVQRASPSTQAYAEIGAPPRLSVPKHCTSNTSTVRRYKHKYPCVLCTPPRLSMPYTVQSTHTRRGVRLHMPTAVHTHIHVQYTLLGLSKPNTLPHVNTRKTKCTRSSIHSDRLSRPGRLYAAAQHHTENTWPCPGPVRVLYTRVRHSHAPINTRVRSYVHCHRNLRAVRSQMG